MFPPTFRLDIMPVKVLKGVAAGAVGVVVDELELLLAGAEVDVEVFGAVLVEIVAEGDPEKVCAGDAVPVAATTGIVFIVLDELV